MYHMLLKICAIDDVKLNIFYRRNLCFLIFFITAVGEPYLKITVQPAEKFRFRYRSEMMGTHGALVGVPHGNSRKKPAPAVKVSLINFMN